MDKAIRTDLSFSEAERCLTDRLGDWLPAAANRAGWARLSREAVGPLIRVGVVFIAGAGASARSHAEASIRWTPRSLTRWLPDLQGIVSVDATPGGSLLRLRGTYVPPFGKLGEFLDRLVMHLVAEATVRDLLRRIAARMRERADEILDTGRAIEA